MSGEDLYQLYQNASSESGVGIDDWDDLDDQEKEIWDRTAEMLPDMPSAG